MRKIISKLLTLLIVIASWYGFQISVNPYIFRDVFPNFVMAAAVGQQNFYFPMRQAEPRFITGYHGPETEAVIWFNLDPQQYRLMNQETAQLTPDKIDVAVSSDANPDTQLVTTQFDELTQQRHLYVPSAYALPLHATPLTEDFLGRRTRITCQKNSCILYNKTRRGERLIITFAQRHLPHWKTILKNSRMILCSYERPPGIMEQAKNVIPEPLWSLFIGLAKFIA